MADLGSINVQVQSEGTEEAADKLESVGDGDGGISAPSGGGGGAAAGGGMLGSLMASIKGMSTAMMGILGVVGVIAALLASLKPIQKMIGALFKVIQAFVMPLAVMLMRLLMPVLKFLLKLLPGWYDFLSNPEGVIQSAMAWLESAMQRMVDDIVAKVLPGRKDLPGFGGLTGDPETSILPFTDVDYTDPNVEDPGITRDSDTSINFFGGIGTFIERWQYDETTPTGPGPGQ